MKTDRDNNENQTSFDRFRHWLKAKLYIGVGKSLLIWFLLISVIPLFLISVINYYFAYAGLNVVAEKSLVTTSQLRVEYLENYFNDIINNLETQSSLESNISFFDLLENTYRESGMNSENFTHSDRWDELTAEKRHSLVNIFNINDYYNLYFVNTRGDILFSLRMQDDIGKNLFRGEYSTSAFAKMCKTALESGEKRFSDIEKWKPSGDMLSGFFGQPMRNKDGEVIGVIAIQINTAGINNIIMDDVGVGETGEAFIIGPDLIMRSATRFEDESIILNRPVKTDKTLEWQRFIRNIKEDQYLKQERLDKEIITIYANYKGEYVLGIYRHLDFLEDLGVHWALVEEIEQSEAYGYAQQLSDIAKISFIVTIIIVFFISVLVTKKIVTPIKVISAWAKQVAIGELVKREVKAPENEVGEMVDTFNSLVNSLHSYAEVSESAALGDYSKSVIIRSEKDLLGKSMNQMVESFKKVVEQANRIAKGNYSTNIVPRSEKDTLGIALYEMTNTLRVTSREMQEQDWLKTGWSRLESKLSGLKDLKILTKEVISFIVTYLDANLGLLYIYENNKLKLAATHAFKDIKNLYDEFEMGQGIIGQVAQERKREELSFTSKDLPKLNFGVDEKKPFYFVACPFVFENELKGVILLGSFKKYTELQYRFLHKGLDNIAIAVNTVQSHGNVERLLLQTQEQAKELQVQQEELRQANEELEEQTKALKLSEENLKNQQEELRVINEELEERTNDLEIERDNIRKANEELKKAQAEVQKKARDLEQASRYKSEFLANMSHELRTPLNSILVLSQLLKENRKEHLDKKEVEFAKTINSSGSDLLNLINEILDLSKVESGKIDLLLEDVYFSEIESYVLNAFKPLTDEKKLDLIIKAEKRLPEKIHTDNQRLMQVLKNLVSNAVKFTKQGNVTLDIHRPNKDQVAPNINLTQSNAVAFTVSDTGIGIPKEKLKLIFEAFQQADGTTSRKYGGTGLGLTITRSFSELLRGAIFVESEENKGSKFTLVIPESIDEQEKVKTTDPKAEEKNDEPVAQMKSRKRPVKKVKDKYADVHDDKDDIEEGDNVILIIEDDLSFSNLLYDLSHEKGFKALITLDGETGLHYADFYKPDAILLDIGLPGIDGYGVMKRLKENANTRHIPVHIISASDKSIDAMKMGAIGYLTKPVSNEKLEEVFKKIENLIARPIKKALVVEDDSIMRKSIVNLLNEGNVEIRAVDSGEKAFSLLQKEKFECMILDLGLDELSGFELLEKIRREKKITDIPVIIYTGQELSKEEDEKLQKYADSIILKGARSFERLLSEATLFLHQVQSEMPADKQKMLQDIQSKEDVLSGKKILIVDDDMRNVFALSSVLETNGMKVVIGKNGRDGLEKLKKNPDTSLVLMDIMMPIMDGYEAMMEIRKQKKYEKLPIIALTAKAMKEDRARCIAAGANDYLAKPFNTDKLISLLRVWLYGKK